MTEIPWSSSVSWSKRRDNNLNDAIAISLHVSLQLIFQRLVRHVTPCILSRCSVPVPITSKWTLHHLTSQRQVTKSFEQSSSSEAHIFSVQKVPACILWKPKIRHRFHNSLLPVPVLSQWIKSTPQPVYWGSILILPSDLHRTFPSCPLCFGFRPQNPTYVFLVPHACYTPHPSHSSGLYHSIIRDMECRPLYSLR